MLLAFAIGAGMVGYLRLSNRTLVFAQRALFLKNAEALAEAGLEEALYSFRQVNAGQSLTTAWTGWTISGADASRTLPTFNCDQNAIGTVKVYVTNYTGAAAAPVVFAQAAIGPFDGSAPVVKTLRIKLRATGQAPVGIIALNGLSWAGQTTADSFDSNPSDNPAGPWLAYSAGIAQPNATIGVAAGTVTLSSNSLISGNLALAAGIVPPAASRVTGTITNTYAGSYSLPAYPTAAGVSVSYNLAKTVPATLPRAGDSPAADGRYYYFFGNAVLKNTTITAGKKVTLVGNAVTTLTTGIVVSTGASCFIYIDGAISAGSNGLNNTANWAGALQIFTSTTSNCTIGGSGQLNACVYAPNAALTCSGGTNALMIGAFVAKSISSPNKLAFHLDAAVSPGASGLPWVPTAWFDLQTAADRATVAGLSKGYLR